MISPSAPPPTTIGCRHCGQVHALAPLAPGWTARCRRCGSTLERHTAASLHKTAAFALAALLLFLPANVFPILRMNLYGASATNTVWEGCVHLYQSGDAVIAIIVFMASIFVPLVKLMGLIFLVAASWSGTERGRPFRAAVYRVVEAVGRWAMLDVFVLAVLVSLVKLQGLASVVPGPGLLAFSGVVVFTILASASFDPQLIWHRPKETTP